MIPYEIDPSLHHAEPAPGMLDDGFSPPLPRRHDDDDTLAEQPVAPVPARRH